MENHKTMYPQLSMVAELISSLNVFQKKAVAKLMSQADEQRLAFGESVVDRLNKVVGNDGANYAYLAKAYIDYTKSIRQEEMYFAKNHKYRVADFQQAYEEVYSRDDYMHDYVIGLGMTQFFWPNHYGIFRFFLDEFCPLATDARVGAEVGVGHGLFHAEMLRHAPQLTTTLLDISPTSLATCRKTIAATGLDPERAAPVLCDIQKSIPLEDASLDVLLMGELVEYIQDGERVMTALCDKIKPGGVVFFSSAANAPAEDHILLFRSTGEIRDLIDRSGFRVDREYVGTLGGMSVEEAEAGGHNINYAAALRKK